jgi:LytS/YehU family sensor histidine kinase
MEFAEIYTHLQQYDSALYRYNLFDSANADEKDLRVFLVSKGEYYLAVKQYSNALQNFLKGLHYHKKLKDTNEIMRTLLNIGKTYAALKAYKAALQYTREGLGIALQTKAKQFIRDGYQTLYLVYDKTQNVDSAFFYYRQYNSMKDLVASAQVKAKFREYNYEQKIIILNQENQIQQAKLARESFQKKLFIAGILVLLALGLMIYRNIFLKRKNEVNRLKIAENELQLQKLESEQTQKELQHKATELEIQALRAQMNPHFIFNCLSSINRFILKNESEAASDYLTKFSRLIRMVLINSKKSFITLEDDLEMLRLYLEMERLRFKNSFDYSMSFQNEVDAGCIYIPPLLLQPFVENAIWHGLMNKEDNGKLLISISKELNYLTCIIEDNGIGRSKATELNSKSAEKKKSLGLQITKERLALLNKETDENTYFEVKDLYDKNGDACGTRIILKITLAEKQEENSPTTNFTL